MPIRHFYNKVLVVALIALAGVGCSDQRSEEESAFRKALVDKALNDETRKAGDAFLNKNAQRAGVVSTASGLQYEVIEQGDDSQESPRLGDQVDVRFKGQTVSGNMFADSFDAESVSTFPLNKVIRGWREALMLMHPGDYWIVYLPPELAYGATSPSEHIPANSSLIYHIKLVGFQSLKEQTAAGSQHE